MNAFFETTNGFNFQIIDPLIESRGVRLTWFDCKQSFPEDIIKSNERKSLPSAVAAWSNMLATSSPVFQLNG